MEPCANCGVDHQSTFCPACGQKRVTPGVRLGQVAHEFVGTITHAEGPVLNTFLGFFRGPGAMTRAFLAGKRKAFVPPVRYFLLGIGYYYLVRFILHWDPVDNVVEAMGSQPVQGTGAMRVNHWMSRHMNLLLPVLLIILSTFDRLLFPRANLSWVERFVHYLFACGTYLIVASTLLPLTVLWPPMQLFNFFIIFGIVIWACISLHETGAWNAIKAVLMVPLGFTLYVFLCSMLVAWVLGVPLGEVFVRPSH